MLLTISDLYEELKSDKYNFLRDDKTLGDNIIMLNLSGSYAYGTNTEGSDLDLRGVFVEGIEHLLGMTKCDYFENLETDTKLYGFNRIIELLMDCNPDTISMLGCKPDHYLILTDAGKMILDNKKLFLSKRAINSFGCYADAQLNRLKNALAHDRVSQEEHEKHILRSINHSLSILDSDLGGSFKVKVEQNKENGLYEIYVDTDLRDFPARRLKGIADRLSAILRDYDKLNNRNKKKDLAHLNKHAMHLVRLYCMGLDIIEKGEIITYRENEHNMLMDIRSGKYLMNDNTYSPDFFELVDNYNKRLEYAAKNTVLPDRVDMKGIEELKIEINKQNILSKLGV